MATRLDGFTVDEAYHIAAGVSYFRLGDYRLNPEHPPLVKLWVAAFLPSSTFQLPPLRPISDKLDERHYTGDVVYLQNDPDFVQHRARIAMFVLNGMLLLALALAIWKVSGHLVALGALAFLVIDPTVAAHLPIVMTDLPIALTGTTALLLAYAAFVSWRPQDIVLAGLSLGIAFATKHSAPVVIIAVVVLGAVMAFRSKRPGDPATRLSRLLRVAAVLLVAWVVLWGFYRFRFNESPAGLGTNSIARWPPRSRTSSVRYHARQSLLRPPFTCFPGLTFGGWPTPCAPGWKDGAIPSISGTSRICMFRSTTFL